MELSDMYFLQMMVGSSSVLSTVQVCYISKACNAHIDLVVLVKTLTLTMNMENYYM